MDNQLPNRNIERMRYKYIKRSLLFHSCLLEITLDYIGVFHFWIKLLAGSDIVLQYTVYQIVIIHNAYN